MDDLLPRAAFDVSERDGHVVLRVSGEIDLAAKSLFEECLAGLIEANHADVVVDLADVTFIDSSSISVLLFARRQLTAAGRRLLIARPSVRVSRVLELTGVDAVFDKQC